MRAFFLLILFVGLVADNHCQAGADDNTYPLYPYTIEYSKGMCSLKMMLDPGGPNSRPLEVDEALQYIRELDNLTREIPKLMVLVGFQEGGHDRQYPMWGPVNPKLKRPQDDSATDSLLYLMRTAASQYHTHCTVHVNMVEGYEESPLWQDFLDHGLICRNKDGSLVKIKHPTRPRYAINMRKAWDSGKTKELIDGLVEMLPVLKDSGVIYTDANHRFAPSPFDGITYNDQIAAYKAAIRYMKSAYGIDCIGEFGADNTSALYGFVPIGLSWSGGDPMKLAPYLSCGGNDNGPQLIPTLSDNGPHWLPLIKHLGQELQIFGHAEQMERGPTRDDPLSTFALNTLPFVFLNGKLRVSYDSVARIAVFSDGVKSFIDSKELLMITQNGKNLRVGGDVFIPEIWRTNPEIMAYSKNGYEAKNWDLPDDWSGVKSVDIYEVTKTGPRLLHGKVMVQNHQVQLTLKADQGQIIVAAATDVNSNPPRKPAGAATFVNIDADTHGTWKAKYGTDGYDIIGDDHHLPSYATLSYIGTSDVTWSASTTEQKALQKPNAATDRVAASKQSQLHQIIDVSLNGGLQDLKKVSLYLLDWDNAGGGRQTLVDVLDANTGKLLDSRIINDYQNGKYLTYRVGGHIQIRLTRLLKENMGEVGPPSVSGVFFN